MENVKLENYGDGWKWYATSGKQRNDYKGARAMAIKTFGMAMVLRAEVLAGIRDPYVLAYAADQCNCSCCFGGISGGYDLLHTPDIDGRRYAAYLRAAKELGLPAFANMPPNWRLVVNAADPKHPHQASEKETLARVGQLGLGMPDAPTDKYPLCSGK